MRRGTIAFCLLLSIFFLFANEAGAASATLSKSTKLPSSLSQGLVGYWSFNGPDISGTTAYDRSGQGNDATLAYFTPPFIYGKLDAGKNGQGLNFFVNASGAYANAGKPASLNNITQLTLSTWVRLSKEQPNRVGYILGKGNHGLSSGWILCYSSCSTTLGEMGRIQFVRYYSGGSNGVWRTTATSTKVYGENEWVHIVLTYDDTSTGNDPTIYINGSPVSITVESAPSGTLTNDNSGSSFSGTFTVGSSLTGATVGSLKGNADEVRIYNRILSAAEVKQLYRAEKGVTLAVSPEKVKKYTTRTLDASGNVGLYTSIAIGRDGYPVISYYDNINYDLKFVKCADITCSSSTVSTLDSVGTVGLYTSIAIGRDGYPVISYNDGGGDTLKLYKCNDPACTTGTASVLDDPANLVGRYTSIAIGRDGYPVISYYDVTARSLKFYKCNDIACTSGAASTLDDPANWVGSYTSIAIGRDGYPVISYNDGIAFALKFYKCNDVACTSGTAKTLEDIGNSVGTYTSLAIGGDGNPVIAHYNDTSRDLKVLKCADQSCSATTSLTLDTTGDVGSYASLAIGRDGYPVIAYWDGTNKDLRFLKCNDVSCSTTVIRTVDAPGDVGRYASLTIGRDGNPVIAYNDATANALKFAYVGGLDTQGPCMGLKSAKDADGNSYNTIGIGTQCWLDRNMNVGTRINGVTDQTNNGTIEKNCYSDIGANCTTNNPNRPDGGLYQWNEAMQYSVTEKARGICPSGFHIPSDAEWFTLENYLKDAGQSCNGSRSSGSLGCSPAGVKMQPNSQSGFEGNLAGYGNSFTYNNRGSGAYYWSSTQNGANAWSRVIGSGGATVSRTATDQARSLTVRCIKN